MTKVIFRMQEGEVTAYMPEYAGTNNPDTCTCYAYVGQHSQADMGYVRTGRLATPEEYAPLLRELTRIGYKVEVITHVPSTAYKSRVQHICRRS